MGSCYSFKFKKFLSNFFSVTKKLTQNPTNLKALTHLDFLLSQTHSFDSVTSVVVIDCLCNLNKLNRAKNVLFHLKENLKVSPFFVFSLVFDCLVKNGKMDHVEAQWGELRGGCGLNLCDFVFYVCKWGDLDEIKSVCERVLMGCKVLERESYVALIGALCRYNDGLMAKCMVCEMYRRGFDVDGVSYVVLFDCFCRNGDLVGADWVVRKMVKGGCHVDVFLYGSFMHGLCKVGKFREANKLFNKMIKKDHFVGSKLSYMKEERRGIFQLKCEGLVSDMMAYEMYFRSLCIGGKLDEAEMLLKKMMNMREMPQVCVYGSFIKALFRAGREEDAMNFFKVECKKGLVCSDDLARYVAMELSVKGRVDDAMKIFNEFTRSERYNCVILCNGLLGSLWGLGRVEKAETFFERMNKGGSLASPNISTYKLMVYGYCDQGNLRKALGLLEEMSLKNVPIDRNIYRMVIRSLHKHGWSVEAYKYLNEMTKGGFVVSYIGWRSVYSPLLDHIEKTSH